MKGERRAKIASWIFSFFGLLLIVGGYIGGREGRLGYQILVQLMGIYSLMHGLNASTGVQLFKLESSLEEIKKKLEEKSVRE